MTDVIDRRAAKKLYRNALDNDCEAQHYLGCIYSQGLHVTQDNLRSSYWHKKAAIQGYTKSMCNMDSAVLPIKNPDLL